MFLSLGLMMARIRSNEWKDQLDDLRERQDRHSSFVLSSSRLKKQWQFGMQDNPRSVGMELNAFDQREHQTI